MSTSLVLFQSMDYFSDEKPGMAEVCVCWGRTQGGQTVGSNKRFISLVRQPSEEVVIQRTSQIENIVLIYGELGK